jgi:CRP-like cAMP-binding protein
MSSAALGRFYEDGEIVVRQGDLGDCMFVVQDGEVEIVVEEGGTSVVLRWRSQRDPRRDGDLRAPAEVGHDPAKAKPGS